MTTPRLETERLILRSICSDDTEEIFACRMNDESVSRYMQWKASDDINEARSFVEFELKNTERDSRNRWVIVNRATNELIGTCLLFFNEIDGNWDISYNLGNTFGETATRPRQCERL